MKRFLKWALIALAAVGCWAAIQQARQTSNLPAVRQEVVTTQPGVPVGIVALAVLVGSNSGARFVGGLQRWQGSFQTFNAWLIIAIGAYLTLSGSLRLF
jgi:hypothetical protein